MSNSNRGLLISIVVLLIVVCLCTAAIVCVGSLVYLRNAARPASGVEIPTAVVELPERLSTPTALPTLAPQATFTPSGQVSPTLQVQVTLEPSPVSGLAIPAEVMQSMRDIEADVYEIRGLQPDNSAYERVLLSPSQLRQRVTDDFLQDYTPEEAEQDGIVLAALGLLTPGYDIEGLYRELLSEQIAGFYDDQTKEMVVVQGQQFGGPERATYAHEYTHALQDQNFGLRDGLGFDDNLCEEDTERCAAIQALLEGDATLTEENWLLYYSTMQDKQELIEFYSTYESPIFDSAPAFLQDDFLFPYTQGRTFVQTFYDQGGWAGVDELYADPPVSTEQILHPEKYPDDKPVPVTLPDLIGVLGDGWEMVDDNVLGEWYTYLMLSRSINPGARIDDSDAATAADGWGGDRYQVYHQPDTGEAVLVYSSTWDTQRDAREFADRFMNYADARFGNGVTSGSSTNWQSSEGYSLFTLDENAATALWILAPNEATARALSAAVSQE